MLLNLAAGGTSLGEVKAFLANALMKEGDFIHRLMFLSNSMSSALLGASSVSRLSSKCYEVFFSYAFADSEPIWNLSDIASSATLVIDAFSLLV